MKFAKTSHFPHQALSKLETPSYSIFFLAVLLVFGLTVSLARTLEEPRAATMEDLLREVLIASPQRAFLRLWPRE